MSVFDVFIDEVSVLQCQITGICTMSNLEICLDIVF